MERMLSGERWSTSMPWPRKRLDRLPGDRSARRDAHGLREWSRQRWSRA
jgi:hypothetical protein